MIEIVKGKRKGEWYFHVVADNGEIVAQSEAYTRKADAERGAEDFRRAARVDAPAGKPAPIPEISTDPGE